MATNRRDLNSLAPPERQNLVRLMLEYITDDIVLEHRNNSSQFHGGPQFFPRHRQYIKGMEDFLSANGGETFVPLPYWNPTNKIPDEFFPVVKQSNNDPVQRPLLQNQGPIEFEIPSEYTFPAICDFATLADLDGEPGPGFEMWHGGIHVAIGGAMRRVATSPAAPIFWCWHAFIDQVYASWESCKNNQPR